MNRSWGLILLASCFEVGWAVGLKHAHAMGTWFLTMVAIYGSMHFLIMASRHLPVGTAYAVFTGIGASGTVILDFLLFHEPFHITKMLLILLLIAGVIGLKATTDEQVDDKEEC